MKCKGTTLRKDRQDLTRPSVRLEQRLTAHLYFVFEVLNHTGVRFRFSKESTNVCMQRLCH